jgi:two-component system cell cycle sensor histidine kinase/response regulator CckA
MMITASDILNANILIVDDQESNISLLEQLLDESGYSCVASTMDPKEVCALHRKNRYDLILLDLQMPGMDGFEVMEGLKMIDTDGYLPVLAITVQPDHKLRALQAGAKDFIAKPFDLAEVRTRIHNMLEVRLQYKKLENYSKLLERTVQDRTGDLLKANVQLTQEIEERKKAENSLREQERELSTIFENAPFMMLLLDEEKRVRRVNALACSFTGSTIGEMVGRRSGEALRCIRALDIREGCGFDPDCHDCAILNTVASTFGTGKSHNQVEASLPLSIQDKEQTLSFLLATTIVMVADQAMVLLTLQDINEYKKLEAQLQHAQKMESIGTFAGGIAHDFNNILTVVIGYAQLTIMHMSEDNTQRQNLEQIVVAANRAAHLTRDLLLFSRKQASVKKNIDLNEVIRSVEKFLLRVIGEDVTCKTVLPDKAMPVFADAHHIEQVLMNLATNARDAMAKGGEFTIAVEQAKLDHAFIAAHGFGNPGMYAVLAVSDTGSGMDEEIRKQIFDPFFTTKEVGKGTGLGLSVIFGIVKDHDGYVNVCSEPGKGATFRIYLPLIESMANKEEIKPDEVRPTRGTETILLAEDDENVRNLTLSLLGSFGYEVVVAVDGEDAVHKFRENRGRIRLLLFDVVMPKKNGRDAYEEIRLIEPNMKVIFASGYAPDAVPLKGVEKGNVLLISKPYIPANLLAIVRTALDRDSRG